MATRSQASFLLGLPTSVELPKARMHLPTPQGLENSGREELLAYKKRAGPPSTPSESPSMRPTHQSWGLTRNCCVQILHLGLSLYL